MSSSRRQTPARHAVAGLGLIAILIAVTAAAAQQAEHPQIVRLRTQVGEIRVDIEDNNETAARLDDVLQRAELAHSGLQSSAQRVLALGERAHPAGTELAALSHAWVKVVGTQVDDGTGVAVLEEALERVAEQERGRTAAYDAFGRAVENAEADLQPTLTDLRSYAGDLGTLITLIGPAFDRIEELRQAAESVKGAHQSLVYLMDTAKMDYSVFESRRAKIDREVAAARDLARRIIAAGSTAEAETVNTELAALDAALQTRRGAPAVPDHSMRLRDYFPQQGATAVDLFWLGYYVLGEKELPRAAAALVAAAEQRSVVMAKLQRSHTQARTAIDTLEQEITATGLTANTLEASLAQPRACLDRLATALGELPLGASDGAAGPDGVSEEDLDGLEARVAGFEQEAARVGGMATGLRLSASEIRDHEARIADAMGELGGFLAALKSDNTALDAGTVACSPATRRTASSPLTARAPDGGINMTYLLEVRSPGPGSRGVPLANVAPLWVARSGDTSQVRGADFRAGRTLRQALSMKTR